MPALPTPLIQSAIAGDHTALVELLAAARPDIQRYARATCRASDVDDAVQDALWLLYRRVGTIRVVSSFSAWLFALVRRECLRLARSFRMVAADVPAEEQIVLSQPDEALRLDVAAAIQSLPQQYRMIVVMRDMEERTVDEMAEALGLTREAVKGRLHRARGLLREYLLR